MSKGKQASTLSNSNTSEAIEENRWRLHFMQVLMLTLVLRFVFATFGELKYEEAYYWLYGQHLSLSYFDHPPLIGWLIALSTQMLGQVELAVRLPALVLSTAGIAMLYKFVAKVFSPRSAFYTAIVLLALPAFEWYSMFVLPDAPLLFFWTLGLIYGYRLLEENKPHFWWIIGLATGLGMLSKYPGALIPVAPLLFICLEKRWKLLANIHFFGAIFLAIGLFSPVIVWNYQHEWCSFLFQGVSRFSEAKGWLDRFGGSLLNQVLILSPGGLILGIWAMRKSWQHRTDKRYRYLLCASLPFMGLMLIVASLRLVQMNWPLPGYVAGVILLGLAVEEAQLLSRRKVLMSLVFIPAIAISFLPLVATLFPIGALNRANEVKGWKELGPNLLRVCAAFPDPEQVIIVGSAYQIASEAAFYTQTPQRVYASDLWGVPCKGFTYWTDLEQLKGSDAVIVAYEEMSSKGTWKIRGGFDEERMKRHFEAVAPPERLTIFHGGKPLRRYQIFVAHNYLGLLPEDREGK